MYNVHTGLIDIIQIRGIEFLRNVPGVQPVKRLSEKDECKNIVIKY
mgnify:CR=1 FL=1|jgi:hypothetical protein